MVDNSCEAIISNTETVTYYNSILLLFYNFFFKYVILDENNIFEYIASTSSKFKSLCLLAHDLRQKGWHLRRGINYGADFLLYSSSPDDVHSK